MNEPERAPMDMDAHVEASPAVTTVRRTRARLQSVRRTVRVGNLRMSALDWTGPEHPVNPPVVILHGALQTAEGMANLASHLARRGRVVAPDLRGRGETAQPDDGYDPSTMAADVAGLIEQLGIDRPVVIGRLHGGLVAYRLAAEHPQALTGLVIGDTVPEVGDGHAQRLIEATRNLPRTFPGLQDAYDFYQRSLGLSLERALHDIPFDLRPSRGGFTWRHNLDLIERIEAAALPRSDWDLLASIRVPTMVLRGQRGALSAEMARRMCEQIEDCFTQTILTSGRDVFLGGGAEQAFAAIDLFLLRLTDTGFPQAVAPSPQSHARTFVEPLVRALNGRDAGAVRAMLAPDAEIELVRGGQSVTLGGADTVETVMHELFSERASAVFAVEQLLASRREASMLLVSRAMPAADSVAVQVDDTLYLGVWLDVADGAIVSARFQVARVPA